MPGMEEQIALLMSRVSDLEAAMEEQREEEPDFEWYNEDAPGGGGSWDQDHIMLWGEKVPIPPKPEPADGEPPYTVLGVVLWSNDNYAAGDMEWFVAGTESPEQYWEYYDMTKLMIHISHKPYRE